MNIKNVSHAEIMAAHLVPPQMMAIMPSNVVEFGDTEKARNITISLMRKQLNLKTTHQTKRRAP